MVTDVQVADVLVADVPVAEVVVEVYSLKSCSCCLQLRMCLFARSQ